MNHCWHYSDSNRSKLSFPPSEEQVCCFCGKVVHLRQESPPGHGQYLPQLARSMKAPPEERCPKRKQVAKKDSGNG